MAAKPLNISSTTPVSLTLRELFSRAQHIKFEKRSLIYEVRSQIDQLSGATKSTTGSSQIFKFDTSKASHHGLVKLMDKRTRVLRETAVVQSEGDSPPYEMFDWRTIIFFRFPNELNIPEIKGYVPGFGWVTINLRNRRFWKASPTDEEGIKDFNSSMKALAEIRLLRSQVQKQRDNGKKRKFMEGVTSVTGVHGNRYFVYEKISGTADKLFDPETDEEVKKVRSIQPNKNIALVGDFELEPPEILRAENPDDVAMLAARFEILGELEKRLCKSIRETELGLIEDFMIGNKIAHLDELDGQVISYGRFNYTVKLSDAYSYDYPEGTADRWRNGELEMRTVETNAQWRARETEPSIVRIIPQDSPHVADPCELV